MQYGEAGKQPGYRGDEVVDGEFGSGHLKPERTIG